MNTCIYVSICIYMYMFIYIEVWGMVIMNFGNLRNIMLITGYMLW